MTTRRQLLSFLLATIAAVVAHADILIGLNRAGVTILERIAFADTQRRYVAAFATRRQATIIAVGVFAAYFATDGRVTPKSSSQVRHIFLTMQHFLKSS